MNVKTLSNNLTAVDRLKQPDSTKAVKAENSSADRDADGRRQREDDTPKRSMTEEELQIAMENLRSLEGVQRNNLVVELKEYDGAKIVYLKDMQGKVIRRIVELDLWPLLCRI